jgi:hypothetical protein
MMKDSESIGERGDPELFRIAQRLSSIFYCVTNAFNYVRINCEERKWWGCASEALRRFTELFVFTKLTRWGKSVFSDRLFEWSQRDLRGFVGKKATPGYKPHLRCVEHSGRHRGKKCPRASIASHNSSPAGTSRRCSPSSSHASGKACGSPRRAATSARARRLRQPRQRAWTTSRWSRSPRQVAALFVETALTPRGLRTGAVADAVAAPY